MQRFGSIVPGVRKIAVLRANAIGDLIFSLPALHALRASYPQAEIVLLGQPWHHEFLTGRPGPVDRVEVVPPSKGVHVPRDTPLVEDPAELDRFFTRMADEHFDIAIQMHGGGSYSNPFVQQLGARLTVGMHTPGAPALDRVIPYVYYQHEVLRCLEVVALVGARTAEIEPRIAVTQADLDESLAIVPPGEQPIVVFHVGAGDPRRWWPSDKFAAVGDALAVHGARIVVSGIVQEQQVVNDVVAAMREPAQAVCSQLSLGGLAGLLSRSALVISNDSGPLHLAAATGTATVGIYWCGNMINAMPLLRARHRPAISWRLACPVCGADCIRENCAHRVSFVADVSVDEVLGSARDLLEQHLTSV